MTSASITFEVPGTPVAKGRPRFSTRSHHVYTPSKTRAHEKLIRGIALVEMNRRNLQPFSGAVSLSICAIFAPPKSWPKWKRELALQGDLHHTTKPDLDNVEKLIIDGLTGIVIEDDAQIIDGRTKKLYSATPITWVTVTQVPGSHSQTKKKPQ